MTGTKQSDSEAEPPLLLTELVMLVKGRYGLGYERASQIVEKAVQPIVKTELTNLLQRLEGRAIHGDAFTYIHIDQLRDEIKKASPK